MVSEHQLSSEYVLIVQKHIYNGENLIGKAKCLKQNYFYNGK